MDENANNFFEYVRRYGQPVADERPCAPLLAFNGSRSEVASRIRSAISPWFDIRRPLDVIRDRIEERGLAMAAGLACSWLPCGAASAEAIPFDRTWGAFIGALAFCGARYRRNACDLSETGVVERNLTRSPVEHGAGQSAGHKGAGVDVDPVGQDLRRFGRSVAVHHDLAEIGAARKKLVAYPQQVLLGLALQRHAGANTGMAQEVFSRPSCWCAARPGMRGATAARRRAGPQRPPGSLFPIISAATGTP